MIYVKKSTDLLKRRNTLKTLSLLSLSPALASLGILSIKDVYDNISIENKKELNFASSSIIELSPVLLTQIEEYLEECKNI